MTVVRRRLPLLIGAAAAMSSIKLSNGNAQSPAPRPVRMTTGLTAATQGMGWIGTKAGAFREQGLDVTFPAQDLGGPKSVEGMVRGDWVHPYRNRAGRRERPARRRRRRPAAQS
jgi:hypothetical protein